MIKLNGELIGHGTFLNKEVTFISLGKLIKPLEENTVTVRYDHREKTFEAFVMLAAALNRALAGGGLILEMPYMPYIRGCDIDDRIRDPRAQARRPKEKVTAPSPR